MHICSSEDVPNVVVKSPAGDSSCVTVCNPSGVVGETRMWPPSTEMEPLTGLSSLQIRTLEGFKPLRNGTLDGLSRRKEDLGRPLGLPDLVGIGDLGMFSHAVRCAGKSIYVIGHESYLPYSWANIYLFIWMFF